MATAIDLQSEQLVTSSDLVRHFGLWQDRAARQPVYVLHRGRPRFVLTSVDLMDALCTPRADTGDAQPLVDTILDAIDDILIVVDRTGRITTTSRAARRYCDAWAEQGAAVDAVTSEPTRPLLTAAIGRVIDTGMSDRIEIPSAARPDRTLELTIAPYPSGALICGRDGNVAEEIRAAAAETAAIGDAIGVTAGAASVRLNLRGHIETFGADFAALTGLSTDGLTGLRFVTLIDIADRIAVSAAIDAAIGDGLAQSVAAKLLINRAAPLPVRIGLAPHRKDMAIDALTVVLFTAPAG